MLPWSPIRSGRRATAAFARRHETFILSDLAYAEIYFEQPPPSILEVTGAKQIAVEFTSMSKTYNMPGWRIGFAAGNQTLIAALTRIKSYLDYCVEANRQLYKKRRDVLVGGLCAAGWQVPSPPATMFVWAPVPERFRELGSLAFSKLLLQEANVATSPGIGFGEYGEDHVRLALVENRHRLRQAVRNVKAFLTRHGAVAEPSRARAVA